MSIPSTFTEDGILEPGTYEATFDELKESILVKGDGSSKTWNSSWRLELVENANILTNQLWKAGVEDIFFDGSFVEDKDHPNDIDGYFDPHLSTDSLEEMETFKTLICQLNDLDPNKIWNWDPTKRKKYRGYPKAQLPMWHKYRVELYPHLGQRTGIKDQHGNELKFPAAFRQSRHNYKPKGIVKIVKKGESL
ncbi:MAG: hypothetical protein R3B45_09595 [Bdellovibrionota bacterium]